MVKAGFPGRPVDHHVCANLARHAHEAHLQESLRPLPVRNTVGHGGHRGRIGRAEGQFDGFSLADRDGLVFFRRRGRDDGRARAVHRNGTTTQRLDHLSKPRQERAVLLGLALGGFLRRFDGRLGQLRVCNRVRVELPLAFGHGNRRVLRRRKS